MYFRQIFLIISEVHKGPCCVFVGIGDRICYNVKLLQLFIMEMRTLACGFVMSGCS